MVIKLMAVHGQADTQFVGDLGSHLWFWDYLSFLSNLLFNVAYTNKPRYGNQTLVILDQM